MGWEICNRLNFYTAITAFILQLVKAVEEIFNNNTILQQEQLDFFQLGRLELEPLLPGRVSSQMEKSFRENLAFYEGKISQKISFFFNPQNNAKKTKIFLYFAILSHIFLFHEKKFLSLKPLLQKFQGLFYFFQLSTLGMFILALLKL